jgi:hypothetical protein
MGRRHATAAFAAVLILATVLLPVVEHAIAAGPRLRIDLEHHERAETPHHTAPHAGRSSAIGRDLRTRLRRGVTRPLGSTVAVALLLLVAAFAIAVPRRSPSRARVAHGRRPLRGPPFLPSF